MTNDRNMTSLWRDERAANAVEYALVAAVIAIALIVAFGIFKDKIAALFQRQGNKLDQQS